MENTIQRKEHFKMYKDGKRWVFAGLATFAVVGAVQIASSNSPIHFGDSLVAHAADSNTNYWMGQNTDYFKRYNDAPNASSVPLSTQQGWGYASGEIKTLQNPATGTTFKFDSLTYDQSTGLYTLSVKLNVPVLTQGGSGRTSYLDFGLSDSLASKTTGTPTLIAANGQPGTLNHNADGTYSNSFSAGGYVGGTSTIKIQINPVKIQSTDEISAMYSSDTPTTGYHAIFSSVRTMGYNDFGLQFNQTLLTQMKQNSLQAVKQATHLSAKQAQAANDAINNTQTTDDFVNKLQAIDKDVQAKNAANALPIDQQRANALATYKKNHNVDGILNDIANDPTLTQAQKDAQSKQVNDAVAVIQNNLNGAQDSDDVANVIADTSQDQPIATAHQQGEALANQISDAQAELAKALADEQAIVDGQNNLTDVQKQAQKQALATLAQGASRQIANAQNSDAVAQALKNGKLTINRIDNLKQEAYSTLTAKANSAISTINNDPDLTDAQKADRVGQINTALKGLTDTIDPATDILTIQNAMSDANFDTTIANATSSTGVTPIATQKATANANVDQTATDTKAKIDADNSLTDKEKAQEKANVDAAVTQAKTDIQNGTAQTLATVIAKAQGNIQGQYVAGKALKDRQKDAEDALNNAASTAKSNLDAQVAQANNDINNNNYLTDAQKQAQKDAIQKAAQAAIDKINSANTADAVNDALADGQNVVNGLNAQKLAAHTSVNTEAKNAEDAINANPALTATDKANRVAQIEAAKATAGDAIDSATDANVISSVPASGNDFDKAVKAASDLTGIKSIADQQTAAKAQLDNAGTNAKNAIDQAALANAESIQNDGSLSPQQKTAQKAALDQAVANAKANIDKAQTADDINNAMNSGLANVNALNNAKTNAIKALATQAQNAIAQINANDGLTQADHDARIASVKQAYQTAVANVDNATTPADVATAQNSTDFSGAITKATDFTGIKSLVQQKQDALNAVANAVTALKAKIDADPNISATDKTTQKSTLDNEVKPWVNIINNDSDSDSVSRDLDNATFNINNDYDKTRWNALSAKRAIDAHDAVNNNSGLTQAQKGVFNKQIDEAHATAQNAVNTADGGEASGMTVDDNSDYKKTIDGIVSQANAVESLANQIKDAQAKIDNEVATQTAQINNDSSLSDAEKQAMITALGTTATNAKNAIGAATNADDLATKAQANDIAGVYQAKKDALNELVSGLAQSKTIVQDVYDNQADEGYTQKQINDMVDEYNNTYILPSRAKVIAETNANSNVIDNDAFAPNIYNLYAGKGRLPGPGFNYVTSLADQVTAAQKTFTQNVADAKAKIDADKNLSDADKTAQKAKIDAIATPYFNEFPSAKNADVLAQELAAGQAALNALDKTQADQTLADKVAQAKSQIANDPTLTAQQKADKSAQVDTAAKTAQQAIDNATTATDANAVPASGTDFDKAIQAATTSGTSLADQKTAADAQIDSAATAQKANIDKDSSLSDADKTAQKATIDQLAQAQKTAINATQNADDLNKATATGVNTINVLDKTSADKALSDKIAQAEATVNADPNLTKSEQLTRINQLESAKNNAQNLINQATTPDAVNQALNSQELTNAINNATSDNGVATLADQKATAEKAIDDAANGLKAKIDADPNLSDADKTAQKAVVDNVANENKGYVSSAKNADEVYTYSSYGVSYINNHLDKTDYNAISAKRAGDAHTAINDNPALTQIQKDDFNKQIDNAQKTAQNAVNGTDDNADAKKVVADDSDYANKLADILNQASQVPSVANQQQAAEKAIDDATTDAKAKVDADPSLSDADKAAQKATLDNVATQAKSAVQSATNADDINKAQTNGTNAVNALDKTAVNKTIADRINAAKAQVQNDPDLSNAQKADKLDQLNKAEQAVQAVVNGATTPDAATQAAANGSDFDNAVNKALSKDGITSLADQKTAADKAIDDEATKAKATIDADKNLSDADKATQKSAIDQVATTQKANVDKAMDADDITSAKTAGIQAIDALNKTTVDAEATKQAQDAHTAINNNPALTDAQKADFNKQIDDAKATAQNVINNATDPTTAEQAAGDNSTYGNKLADIASKASQVPSVADQQKTAEKAIDDATTAQKAKVDADSNLSVTDKTAQKQALDTVAGNAKSAIQAAATADDINKAEANGVANINGLDKTSADASAAKQAQDAHTAINNNSALSQAQKDAFNKQIDDAKVKAQDAVNKATDATTVANIVDPTNSDYAKTLAGIASQAGQVPTLDSQKSTASKAIDDEATKAKTEIDADPTLSDADKTTQKAVVDSQATAAKNAITSAQDSDDVTKAQADGIKAIDDLENAKKSVDQTLASQAKAAHDAVNNNPALSTAEKASRNQAIDEALNKAQGVVNEATTPDAVNAVVAPNSDFANGTNTATDTSKVPSIDAQKSTAEKAIDDAVTAKKAEIDADPSISDADKQAQKAVIDSLATQAKNNIQAATNADDITSAQNAGVKTIDDLKKVDADKQLATEATNAKSAIMNNPALTDADKQARVQAIDTAVKAAQEAINQATTPDAVNAVLANGGDLDKALKSATDVSNFKTVAEQQADAEAKIDDAANTAKSKIDADPSISDADKQAQKAAIDSLAKQATDNIQAATNADGINKAEANGVQSINDLDKTAVDKQLSDAVANTHKAINDNPALSQAEKDARNKQIDDAAKAAQDLVNKALTPADAENAIKSGSDFDNAVKTATDTTGVKTVAEQQADADKAIDDAVTAKKAEIDADPSVTDADKAAQKAVIDNLAGQAKDAISKATNADDITSAKNNGVQKINDLKKVDADKQLSDAVTNAHKAVNDNPALTQADKDARNKAIDDAEQTAQTAINSATTPADVAKALAQGSDFDNAVKTATDVSNVKTVAEQQADAEAKIDETANTAKAKIDADPSITDADKASQKAVIDDLAKQAKDNIQAATNADDINKAEAQGEKSITDLDKTTADAKLKQALADAHKGINDNPALSQAEKDSRNKAIDDAGKQAQDAINQATTPDAVNAVLAPNSDFANGVTTATDVSKVKTIAQQQADADASIDDAATKAKQAIDADKTLSDSDKQAQKQAIDTVAANAKNAVAAATNSDDITAAGAKGVDDLNKLSTAKTEADAKLADEVAKATEAINANTALSSQQKADRIKALNDAKTQAQDAINKALTPDDVEKVLAPNSDFDKSQTTSTSNDGVIPLSDQKATADKAIDDAATAQKSRIDADTHLSDADKTAQKAVIDSQAKVFKQAIDGATDSDAVTKNAGVGTKALSDLTDAKLAGNAKLAEDVAQAHDAVNINKALTQAEKDARNKALDDAKTQAQDAVNGDTTPTSVKNDANIDDAISKATSMDGVKTVAEQQADAVKAVQDAADKAKADIDADKTLSDVQKADQKAAIDAVAKSATDAINQADNADAINQDRDQAIDTINGLHQAKTDALSKLQKQADDATHAIDNNNALTADQKASAKAAVQEALTKAETITDGTKTVDDAEKSGNQADFNKTLQDIADGLAKVPTLDNQKTTAIAQLTAAVDKAKSELTGPDATAQAKALDKALTDASAKVNAQTNADDLNTVTATETANINGLNKAKADALNDADAKAKQAIDTINADNSLTDDEKAKRIADVQKALQDVHDAVNEATTVDGVNVVHNATAYPEALKAAVSDTGVQPLADRKADAKKALQAEADKVKAEIDANKSLTDAQKTAQKQAIDKALATAEKAIDDATNATKVDVAKATELPTFEVLNKAKADAHSAEDKAYTDAKNAIQNNKDLTDAEKASRIADLDKAHQAASDAIDSAVTPDEIKNADATKNFDTAVKTATDFSKVQSLADRKKDAEKVINDVLQKAIDEVNSNDKLDADGKARQITILKGQGQKALDDLNSQTTAQDVVDFVPTVTPTFEKLNQAKVDARAKLQDQATKAKTEIDNDKTLSTDEKAKAKQAVDEALQKAEINVDNGTDVPTIAKIPVDPIVTTGLSHKSDKTLAELKQEAIASINKQGQELKDKVNADSSLSATQKAAKLAAIDKAVQEAIDKVNAATDADEINDAVKVADVNIQTGYETHVEEPKVEAPAPKTVEHKVSTPKTGVDSKPNSILGMLSLAFASIAVFFTKKNKKSED